MTYLLSNTSVPNDDTERAALGVTKGDWVILQKRAIARFLRFALVAGGFSLLTMSTAVAQNAAPEAPRPPQAIKLPQAVAFSFHEADWSDVLKWLAKLADKSLLMEKKPEGTFTYFDQRTYTLPEAMDVINRALIDKGFVTIIRDNFLIVANLKEGIPPHLVEKVRVEDLPTRAESELVKVLIQLNGQSADTVAKDFEPMLGPYGRIVALKGPNQVMIVDTVRAVRQIVDVIRQIDESDKRAEFRSFPVKNVSVLEVERVVRDLLGVQQRVRQENVPQANSSSRGGDFRDRMRGMFGGGGGFPGMPGGGGDSGSSRGSSEGSSTQSKGAAVSVDLRTNTLFVTAPPDKLALVADVVSTLDVPENATAPEGVDTQLRIEVYTVEPGTADGLSKVLDSVFKQSPDTRVSPHPDGRALIVAATAREHEQIKRVLSQIQSETVKFEAISLRSLDAGSTADLLKALLRIKPETNQQQQSFNRWPFFGGGTSSQQQQNQPPSGQLAIEADIDRNRLLVRGTELQISQVRDILAQLGESGLAGTNRGGKNGNFRVIPLGDRDPAETAETLQRLWQRMDTKTPLKIEVLGVPGSGTPGPAVNPTSIPQDRPQPRQLPGAIAPMSYVAPADEGKNESSEPVVISNALGAITESDPEDTVRFAADEQPATPNNRPKAADNVPPADPNAPATTTTPPVTIVVGPDNIAIHSDDPEALELADRILGSFLRTQSTSSRGVAIFYLKAATAQDAAFLVEEALYGATSSTATSTPRAKLIPDSRTNSLLVIGPSIEQRKVEQMLEIIDRTDPPESDLAMQPRMIKVHNSRAADIAVVVKDIFAKQLYIPSGQAMGGGNNQARPVSTGNPYGQLTVGVDESTNSVVVSAPKQLADEVAQLVETLDTAAKDNGRVAQVVTLKNTRPEVVREALTNLFGVRTGEEVRKTQSSSTNTNNNNVAQQPFQGGYPQQFNMGSGQGGSRNSSGNRSSGSSQRSNSSQNRNSGTRSTNRPR